MAVVNDYEVVIAGLAAMLAPYADRVQVVELDAGAPVRSDVDVILVDPFGHAKHGPTTIEALAADTRAKVLVFAWSTSSRSVERALRDGACGYVTKSASCKALVAAIEATATPRRAPVSWVVQDAPGSKPGGDWPGKHAGLTRREAEILSLIVQGFRNQEIADRACLSINSIKSHIRTAYRKIHARDRAQAVIWGMKNGFEPTPVRLVGPIVDQHDAPDERSQRPVKSRGVVYVVRVIRRCLVRR
ncbi:MAG TPA: response regulator transcription factor [Acidimicrobiia bacterium]|nr:response regulator transcription factor [Acidimicrobiia bacterium]